MISKDYAWELASGVFKKGSFKMKKADFARDIDMSHRSGEMNTCDVILNRHREDPYLTADEVIGDIQIILFDAIEDLRLRLGIKLEPADLNKIIVETGYSMPPPKEPKTVSTSIIICPSKEKQSKGEQNTISPVA